MPDDLTPLSEAARILEAVPGGREWDVLLIEPGLSKNGRYYPAEVLREAAPLFEGAYSYARHRQPGEGERHPNDKVGRFSQVSVTEAGIRARFKVIAPWVRDLLREAMESGEPDFVGFSIDATGRVTRREHDGQPVAWVEAIGTVNSVDLVSEPAAGGRLVRLVASVDAPAAETETVTMDPEEIKRLIAEAVAAALPTPAPTVTEPVKETAPAPTAPAADTSLMEAHRALINESRIDNALKAAPGLSEPGRALVRKDLAYRGTTSLLTEADCAARVTEQQDYEAAFVKSQPVGITRQIAMGDGLHDKLYKALQGWFAGTPVDGVKPLRDLREGYARWTGVEYLDVNPWDFVASFASNYDSGRGAHERVTESLTRSSWGEIFADNLYVMMIKDYRDSEQYGNWRRLVSDLESVPDFQTRHWSRVGGYGDLSTVAEQATYPTLTSPTDEEITYAISKRGGLDDVTMETLIDGRSGRMRKVPTGMARAARRTLYKFVLNMITTDNAAVDYDATTLYHANHGNTGTTALTLAGLDAVRVAMRDQTAYNESLEILGSRNAPKYLIVPAELESRAQRIVDPSDGYTYAIAAPDDTGATMDPSFFKGKGLEVIVYDQLTDATDWFVVADPAQVPTMVMGFLNGQQEPELFVQDGATEGSVFTADKITFKIRHIYGGDILEHRSFYRQVVT